MGQDAKQFVAVGNKNMTDFEARRRPQQRAEPRLVAREAVNVPAQFCSWGFSRFTFHAAGHRSQPF